MSAGGDRSSIRRCIAVRTIARRYCSSLVSPAAIGWRSICRESTEEAAGIFAATIAGGVFVSVNAVLVGHQVAHIWPIARCDSHHVTPRLEAGAGRGRRASESLQFLLFVDQAEPENACGIAAAFEVMRHTARRTESPPSADLADPLHFGLDRKAARRDAFPSKPSCRGADRQHIPGHWIAERLVVDCPLQFRLWLNQLLRRPSEDGATIVLPVSLSLDRESAAGRARDRICGRAADLGRIDPSHLGIARHTAARASLHHQHRRRGSDLNRARCEG